MAELRRRARFASESFEEFGIGGELGVQQLERDVPIEQRVLGFPDHCHAAAGDLVKQLDTARRARGRRRAGSQSTDLFLGLDGQVAVPPSNLAQRVRLNQADERAADAGRRRARRRRSAGQMASSANSSTIV